MIEMQNIDFSSRFRVAFINAASGVGWAYKIIDDQGQEIGGVSRIKFEQTPDNFGQLEVTFLIDGAEEETAIFEMKSCFIVAANTDINEEKFCDDLAAPD